MVQHSWLLSTYYHDQVSRWNENLHGEKNQIDFPISRFKYCFINTHLSTTGSSTCKTLTTEKIILNEERHNKNNKI